ncbi:MAG: hypothetical protein RL417_68 [Pseudomonadota bacterium]|jgi:pimeloyl-ACP methyl ester carboxylesterase
MTYLGWYLSRRGFSVVNLGYRSRSYSIDEHAAQIRRALEAKRLGARPVHFVTHSLGGIVLRRLIEQSPAAFSWGRAVMLGPPNQGAEFARALQARLPFIETILGPSYIEVGSIQRSPGTDRIQVGIIAGTRSSERGYSPFVSGPNDGIVTVRETELPGAADFLVVRGLHSFLMYQPAILRQVAHFLEQGKFERD